MDENRCLRGLAIIFVADQEPPMMMKRSCPFSWWIFWFWRDSNTTSTSTQHRHSAQIFHKIDNGVKSLDGGEVGGGLANISPGGHVHATYVPHK